MVIFCFLFFFGFQASSEELVKESWLAPLVIFGTQSEVIEYPSEPQRLSKQKLELLQTTDISRALKQVSGTYVREEDGLGLRPNIGLRGTNPDRSKKVTLMQDGFLIGPAPYAAPAAYYTPSMILIDSLEVYKGFSALGYGPNSIGGALNYRTASVMEESGSSFKVMTGSFRSNLIKGSVNHKIDDHYFLLQVAGIETDGFKKIDRGGQTGFDQKHFLFKWGRLLDHANGLHHEIQVIAGYENETSNETYLGLTEADFEKSFKRRYNASQLDQMKWNHQKVQIQHQYQISNSSSIETSIYRHQFQRAWYRLDRFRDSSVNIKDILKNPDANSNYYNILTGNQDTSSIGTNGELIVANNDREYYSEGIQSHWTEQVFNQELEFFARIHRDEIKRNHTSDNFEMVANELVKTSQARQTDTLNTESAQALTLFFQDHIRFGNWTLSPGLRFESVQFNLEDRLANSKKSRDDEVFLPGLSLMRKLSPESSLRVSANAAATLAGLSSEGKEKREEANIYEVEWNYMNKLASAESQVTGFLNDYRNLTGTCTVSTGCSGSQLDAQFNGGKALIYGIEAKVGKNWIQGSYDFPVTANITYLKSSFETEFNSTSPEWGVGLIKKGDPLPYVPEFMTSVTLGLRKGRYFQEISLSHQSAVYDQSASSGQKKIAAYGIVDLSAKYSYSNSTKLLAKFDNVLAREYAVSARPFGLRPGKPQSFQLGLQYGF